MIYFTVNRTFTLIMMSLLLFFQAILLGVGLQHKTVDDLEVSKFSFIFYSSAPSSRNIQSILLLIHTLPVSS